MLRRQKRTCVEPAQQHRLEQSEDEGFPCGCRSLVTGQCHKGNSYISEKFISRTFRKDHGSWHRCYSQVWPWTPIVYTGLVFSVDDKKKRTGETYSWDYSNQTEAMSWLSHVLGQGDGQLQQKQMAAIGCSSGNMYLQPIKLQLSKAAWVWLWPARAEGRKSAKTTRDRSTR